MGRSRDYNTDFSTQVNALVASGVKVVFIPIYAEEASTFLTQAKGKFGSDVYLSLIHILGALAAAGMLHGLLHGLVNLRGVGAVHDGIGHAVSLSTAGQMGL